ncbi:hypothetical protein TrRE_jg1687, partial [Triparma retinervis]
EREEGSIGNPLDGPFSASGTSAAAAAAAAASENGKQADPSDDQSYTSSDFTAEPQVTEEQAGNMFMSTRNMERDAFFKARIAHGIDDDKVVDLSVKVNCKLEVEKALKEGGASGVLGCMKMFPDEEGVAKR